MEDQANIVVQFAVVFISAFLTQNILLSRFLGMCSFIAISKNLKTAWGLGVAVTFVTVCTTLLNYGIYHGMLKGNDSYLSYLNMDDAQRQIVDEKITAWEKAKEAGEEKVVTAAYQDVETAWAAADAVAVKPAEEDDTFLGKVENVIRQVGCFVVKSIRQFARTDLVFLQLIIFIMVIAGFVQLVERLIERFSPVLYVNLGIYLPLITVNCAILGACLFMLDGKSCPLNLGLGGVFLYGLGCGLGWLLAICLMAGIRGRLEHADVPRPLRGLGVTIMITGIMAMAFMGFGGFEKNLEHKMAANAEKAKQAQVDKKDKKTSDEKASAKQARLVDSSEPIVYRQEVMQARQSVDLPGQTICVREVK